MRLTVTELRGMVGTKILEAWDWDRYPDRDWDKHPLTPEENEQINGAMEFRSVDTPLGPIEISRPKGGRGSWQYFSIDLGKTVDLGPKAPDEIDAEQLADLSPNLDRKSVYLPIGYITLIRTRDRNSRTWYYISEKYNEVRDAGRGTDEDVARMLHDLNADHPEGSQAAGKQAPERKTPKRKGIIMEVTPPDWKQVAIDVDKMKEQEPKKYHDLNVGQRLPTMKNCIRSLLRVHRFGTTGAPTEEQMKEDSVLFGQIRPLLIGPAPFQIIVDAEETPEEFKKRNWASAGTDGPEDEAPEADPNATYLSIQDGNIHVAGMGQLRLLTEALAKFNFTVKSV
jgi:hypothetical protein